MSRPPISLADFNALTRITPTKYAKEIYAPPRGKTLPMKTGPAGIPIPDPRQLFRPEADVPILRKIVERAFDDYFKSIITEEWTARVSALLRADLAGRFPEADMAVLQRYGLASPCKLAIVRVGRRGEGQAAATVPLAEDLLLPDRRDGFRLFEDTAGDDPIVPADTIPYFQRICDLRAERQPGFAASASMPGRIIARYRRRVAWSEIEEHFPAIGAWMADQRTRSTKDRPHA